MGFIKRILFLIRTLNIGGAEHVLVNIANQMAEDGFAVTVQTLLDEGGYRAKLSPKVQYRAGVRVRSSLMRRVVMKLYFTLPAGLLGRLLIGQGYSHLVAFVEGLPTKIVYGSPQKYVKKIAWIHTDLHNNEDTKGVFGAEGRYRGCYQGFDQVLCVSQDAKAGYIKRIGPHRAIDVQYNPIDKAEIIQLSRQEPAYRIQSSDTFRLVALGRLARVKGFDLLIEAMTQIRKNASRPVELYIIGGGAEEATLEKMIQDRHLQDAVFLCGPQSNPYSIMRQCDMQVISSRAEGYPLALCEGHLLGLPVVSTKCTGPVELITASGGGILVDISAQGLAAGVVEMVNHEALLEECRSNVKRWSEEYSAEAVYAQIEARFS